MSEQPNVQLLLKKGIEAAREGQRAEARKYLEQALELDDKNEKAWFWLYTLVDTDEEKRICLSNVLMLDPNNERAQKAMKQLEERKRQARADEEVIPGITRRQLMLFGGGGAALIIVIIAIFVTVTASRNAQIAAETQQAQAVIALQTDTVLTQVAGTQAAIATLEAMVSPTPTATATSAAPTLPPTFTFTPSLPPPVTPTPLPPPAGLSGTIVGWAGRDVSRIGFLPIVLFPLEAGRQPVRLSDVNGRNPDISRDGQRVVFTRYFPATFDFGLAEITTGGSDERILSTGLPIIKAQMPNYCANANQIIFVALPTDDREIDFRSTEAQPFQVYLLNLDLAGPTGLQRLTNDRAAYRFPAFSPDCSRVAAVRNDFRGSSPGEDVVVIDIATRTQTAVTSDLGAYVESSPRWTPDGKQLVYAAYKAGEPNQNDIYVRPADGSGVPLIPLREPYDEIYPVVSPDGRYIAFASNRTGFYNIFIYEQATSTLWQVTNTDEENYPSGWWTPGA